MQTVLIVFLVIFHIYFQCTVELFHMHAILHYGDGVRCVVSPSIKNRELIDLIRVSMCICSVNKYDRDDGDGNLSVPERARLVMMMFRLASLNMWHLHHRSGSMMYSVMLLT